MTNTSSIKNKANDSARSAYNSVKESASETVSALRNTTEQTVRDTAERLGSDARAMVDTVVTQARDLSSQTRDKIEKQPVQSAAIALAAGFVLGFLFRK